MRMIRSTTTAAITVALLIGSAVTARAQDGAAPQPPVEFTGSIACGPPVASDRAGTDTTLEVGDEGLVLSRFRRGAWNQSIDVSDPRLEGRVYHTWESDAYALPGSNGPEIQAWTLRIENEDGAWEEVGYGGSYADGTSMGDGPSVLIGEGTYAGLTAIYEVTAETPPCGIYIRGVIFEDAPIPEPYLPE
jgi:hypothetical protein